MSEKVIATQYAQRVIARGIARWYDSNGDAAFDVDIESLVKVPRYGEAKTRGWCIQSNKYPHNSIDIEFFADTNGVRAALHTSGVGSCTE